MDIDKKEMIELIRERFVGYPKRRILSFFNNCNLNDTYFTFYDLDDCGDCFEFFDKVCAYSVTFNNYNKVLDEYIATHGKRLGIVCIDKDGENVTPIHDLTEFINSNWDEIIYPKISNTLEWFEKRFPIFTKMVKEFDESMRMYYGD